LVKRNGGYGSPLSALSRAIDTIRSTEIDFTEPETNARTCTQNKSEKGIFGGKCVWYMGTNALLTFSFLKILKYHIPKSQKIMTLNININIYIWVGCMKKIPVKKYFVF
jgi:hypothetical protein